MSADGTRLGLSVHLQLRDWTSASRCCCDQFFITTNMSQFRSKVLDIGCFANIRNIRDHTKRKVFAANEPERYVCPQPLALSPVVFRRSLPVAPGLTIAYLGRQALRYIIRNTTLPQRVRAQAQLQLSQMHCYTRYTQIKNRCIMGGKGRGIFSDFRMGRVRAKMGYRI